MIDFNVNEYVFVQLTDAGRKKLRDDHEASNVGWDVKIPYTPHEEDEDGWSKWQLWVLIRNLGGSGSGMGTPVLFNTNIRIDATHPDTTRLDWLGSRSQTWHFGADYGWPHYMPNGRKRPLQLPPLREAIDIVKGWNA